MYLLPFAVFYMNIALLSHCYEQDTLGLGYIPPTTRVDLGFSLIRNVRRKAHTEKTVRQKSDRF